MKREPDARITKELGREICQRHGIKAMISGTIAKFDRRYLITLEAVNSQTGEKFSVTNAEADGRDQVISALSKAATEMREKLGESLAQIKEFNRTLEATTNSLEALKALSMGQALMNKGDFPQAISLFEDAVDKDPDFAMAHFGLALAHSANERVDLAEIAIRRAYELRERVSQKEKLLIQDYYYGFIQGDIYKTIENLRLGKQMYPGDADWPSALGSMYNLIGRYEKGLSESLEAYGLEQNDWSVCYANVIRSNLALNRFAEAAKKAEAARQESNSLNDFQFHRFLYQISFIESDDKGMQKEIDWFKGRPDEYRALYLRAQAAAYKGEWQRAREIMNRSINGFLESGRGDPIELAYHAELAADLNQCGSAKPWADKILRSFGKSDVEWRALRGSANALAVCGDTARAAALADNISKRYPRGTIANGLLIPLIKAEIDMNKGNPRGVIEILRGSEPFEPAANFRPQYLKGLAYLRLGENEKARSEFQKILDHRGEAPLSILYPLAQLGKARATKEKREYEKFFEIWKDADPDLSIRIEANKEYRALGP